MKNCKNKTGKQNENQTPEVHCHYLITTLMVGQTTGTVHWKQSAYGTTSRLSTVIRIKYFIDSLNHVTVRSKCLDKKEATRQVNQIRQRFVISGTQNDWMSSLRQLAYYIWEIPMVISIKFRVNNYFREITVISLQLPWRGFTKIMLVFQCSAKQWNWSTSKCPSGVIIWESVGICCQMERLIAICSCM